MYLVMRLTGCKLQVQRTLLVFSWCLLWGDLAVSMPANHFEKLGKMHTCSQSGWPISCRAGPDDLPLRCRCDAAAMPLQKLLAAVATVCAKSAGFC